MIRSLLTLSVAMMALLGGIGCVEIKVSGDKDAPEVAHAKFNEAAKELIKLRNQAWNLNADILAALQANDEAKFQQTLPELRTNLESQAKWLKQAKDATVNEDVADKVESELTQIESQIAQFQELEQSFRREAQAKAWSVTEETQAVKK